MERIDSIHNEIKYSISDDKNNTLDLDHSKEAQLIEDDSIQLLLEREIPMQFKNKDNTLPNNDKNNEKKKIIKDNCQVCKINEHKYRCPACLIKTCCLNCANIHKKIQKCSGKKPEYKKNLENSEDLMKDVRYLTNMINKKNNVSKQVYNNLYEKDNYTNEEGIKERSYLNNRNNNNNLELNDNNNKDNNEITNNNINENNNILTEIEYKSFKDKKLKSLIKLTKKFRNATFERCPMYLSRFNENKTYCDSRNKKFYWSIKLHFLNIFEENSISLPSHIFPEPFDDSVYSLNNIIEALYEGKHHIKDVNVLSLLSEVNKEHLKDFEIYHRISKIEYQNFVLMNPKCEVFVEDLRKYNTNNNSQETVIKINDYNYFKKLANVNYNVKIKEILNNTVIKDYLEYYVVLNRNQ